MVVGGNRAGVRARQVQERALGHLAERPFAGRRPCLGCGSGRALRRRRRRAPIRRGRVAGAVAARAALEREQTLVEVLHQLIEPLLERSLPELQLLDPPGQPPELFLELGKADLEAGEPPRILDLDQSGRTRPVELSVEAVCAGGEPRDHRIRLRRGEPQAAGRGDEQAAARPRSHGPCPPPPDQPVVATTVTARRFRDQAVSS